MDINLPLFIVFEGIDGSGKTTLSEILYEYFLTTGIPSVKNQEPSEGIWGKQIRNMLKEEKADPDALLQLFLKDREDDVKRNIIPSLKNEKVIIQDRYYFSNAAYQGAMGISPALIIEENHKRKFPEPDRIYLLDIEPDLALKRVTGRNNNTETEIFEKKDFLKEVRRIYHSIADKRFMILDGASETEDSFNIIKEDFLKNFCNK